jgi:hypothetical protein
MYLCDFDQAFFNVYSGSISECSDEILLNFLKDSDSIELTDGYTHLMDTYIAFRAGFDYAKSIKRV